MSPELQALADAVQAMASRDGTDGPELVTQAIVVWETAIPQADGDTARRISYAVPSDNDSLSGALGLLLAGQHYLAQDALGDLGP